MSLVLNKLNLLFKKLSSCQPGSPNFSLGRGSHGVVSFSTGPQVPESLTLPKLALPRPKELSSPSVPQTWSVNGLESLKDLLSSSSSLLDRTSQQLFSLMRLTLCAEAEVKVRTRHQEESRLSSLCKCRESVMITMVFSYWEQLTLLGNWTQPSEEDSRREFISPFLTCMQELPCSRLEWARLLTV